MSLNECCNVMMNLPEIVILFFRTEEAHQIPFT
jgi:hypothetical protein